jgi:LysM repeat protein
MKLFRLKGKPGTGSEERELVLDTEVEEEAPAGEESGAEPEAEAAAEAAVPEGVVLVQIGVEADSEAKAEVGPSQEDDSLDPGLVDVFRDAEKEAQEIPPASELQDIPIEELLSDLVGVSRRLGITPRAQPEPARDEDGDIGGEPAEETGEEEQALEPDSPGSLEAAVPTQSGHRRYALHGLFLGLALAAAIGGVVGTKQLGGTESSWKSPLIVATVPAAKPAEDGQSGGVAEPSPAAAPVPSPAATPVPSPAATPVPRPEAALKPSPEAAPKPSPEATPGLAPALKPAYFLYTVQRADTVASIAHAFAISPDYIVWNNPEAIEGQNVLPVGEELLIPTVDGMIYRVKPGDTLSAIAALYQIDVESILNFAPNGLSSADNAIGGMVLVLPGAVPPPLSEKHTDSLP